MNHMITSKRLLQGLALGLALGTAATAGATSIVTFQVDMSMSGIDQNTQTVSARGSFNGWGAFPLTNNPTGENPYLYSGTTNLPLNGSVMEYKYVIDPNTWESIPKGHNRLAMLPTTSGESLMLPKVFFADAAQVLLVDLTFQVDMAQQISIGTFTPGVSIVFPKGTFNGWGTFDAMTNDPTILRTNEFGLVTSDVYVGTYPIVASAGQTMDYKFYIDTGSKYEDLSAGAVDPSDNNNRFLNVEDAPTQTLPIVFFSDKPYAPTATNDVTFQVDMTAQVLNGNFDPMTGTVEVRGGFNSWGTPQILCTNDPLALNPNIYTAVVRIVDSRGASEGYKFWASVPVNTGWETMGDNRGFKMVEASSQILPVVFFSNVNPGDLLPEDTLVTFTIDMTNAVTTEAYAFNPSGGDTVYINGTPNGWLGWDTALPQLTNNPQGSGVYSIELLIPKGSPAQITYKYSINGADNEAANNNNHVRYVRTAGPYAMPMDKFGTQRVEPSFGQLSVGPASGGYVPVSWLGLPGVHLQTASDVAGAWNDLMNTDGAGWKSGYISLDGFVSVTNYPTTSAKTFMRLIKP